MAEYVIELLTDRIRRTAETQGIAFSYDGRPINPTWVLAHVRQPDGSVKVFRAIEDHRIAAFIEGGGSHD